jgi:hypothetical protein
MPHVERLADLLVLPPIFLLTSPGAISGGLAYSAVEIGRCFSFAVGAAPEGHDCCWRYWSEGGVRQYSVMDTNRSRKDREVYRNVSSFVL